MSFTSKLLQNGNEHFLFSHSLQNPLQQGLLPTSSYSCFLSMSSMFLNPGVNSQSSPYWCSSSIWHHLLALPLWNCVCPWSPEYHSLFICTYLIGLLLLCCLCWILLSSKTSNTGVSQGIVVGSFLFSVYIHLTDLSHLDPEIWLSNVMFFP